MPKKKNKIKPVRHKKARLNRKHKKKTNKKTDRRYFISYVPEVRLLEKGHVPSETKMGTEFKGKNRVVVSK